jgi:D-glycero-D-manno-heptose 1,7-bisphosphate phosphatase
LLRGIPSIYALMSKPPVFLDRDGTLIVEKEYLRDPDQVAIEKTVIEGLSMLQQLQYPLIVVSNQSGVSRGLMTEAEAHQVNARVDALLREQGVRILAWYICPHGPDSDCACRKPLPGMALEAAREWQLKLAGCFVVGDKRADVEMADAIGGAGILLTTGHGQKSLSWALAEGRPVFNEFRAAAQFIIASETARS